MSELTEQPGDGLNRPYTVGTFQHKLDKFQDFIKDITFQDVEATPEERRQMITGTWELVVNALHIYQIRNLEPLKSTHWYNILLGTLCHEFVSVTLRFLLGRRHHNHVKKL